MIPLNCKTENPKAHRNLKITRKDKTPYIHGQLKDFLQGERMRNHNIYTNIYILIYIH